MLHSPQQEKLLQWETWTPQLESSPPLATIREGSNEDPAQPKKKKKLKAKKSYSLLLLFAFSHIHCLGRGQAGRESMLLLPLSHFSHVRLCATPQMEAHQAPLSLGFSRQEHRNGLPFPSPMHESEKWKWSRSVVSDSPRPHGLQPTRLLRPWDFPGKSTGVGCHCLLWERA